MGIYDISSSSVTEVSKTEANQSTTQQDTSFTAYTPNWAKWHGMYREIPELQAIIDRVALWIAGKGIETKEEKNKKAWNGINGREPE